MKLLHIEKEGWSADNVSTEMESKGKLIIKDKGWKTEMGG